MLITAITTDSLRSKFTRGLLLRPWCHTELGFSPMYATFLQCHLGKIIFPDLIFLIYIIKIMIPPTPGVAMRIKNADVGGRANMMPGCLADVGLRPLISSFLTNDRMLGLGKAPDRPSGSSQPPHSCHFSDDSLGDLDIMLYYILYVWAAIVTSVFLGVPVVSVRSSRVQ